MAGIAERLVPDELWDLFQRVVPEAPSRPQGGGRRRHGDREVLAAIVKRRWAVAPDGPNEAVGSCCHVQPEFATSLMRFVVTIPLDDYGHVTTEGADEWKTYEANLGTVDEVQGYRIGQQEWCTATVVWHLIGSVRSVMGSVFGVPPTCEVCHSAIW